MPFINKEELESLQLSASLLDGVNARVEQLEVQKDEATTALEGLRRNVRVNDAVEEALSQYDDQVILGDIEPVVVQQLVEEGAVNMRTRLAEGLREQKRAEVYRELQISQGPKVKEELDELFHTDGTYEEIEETTAQELRRSLAGDLVAAKKKEFEESIDDPATKEEFLKEHADDILAEAKIEEYREFYLQERENEWRAEAIEELHAKTEHEVLAQKPEIIAAAQKRYAESWDGQDRLKKIRNKVQSEISNIAVEELLAQSGDKEHQRILDERVALEAEKLDKKNKAEKIALEFTNGGIETEAIAEGALVQLMLGAVKITEQKNHYGEVTKRTSSLHLRRKIVVTALGEGLFRVDSDTLRQSDNPYASKQGLGEGSVIKLGMLVRHTKGTDEVDQLVPTLKAGATLQYDTDTSTPEFTDTGLPLADLKIGSVSARKYDEVVDKLF